MISKEQLEELVNRLTTELNLTQEELSIEAGYKPKTITQTLSRGTNLEGVYKNLKKINLERFKNSTGSDDTKDRLIQVLERENKLLQEVVKDLKEKVFQRIVDMEVSLGELKEGQKAVAAVAHAALFHAENISAFQQKKQLKELQKVSDRLIYEKAK